MPPDDILSIIVLLLLAPLALVWLLPLASDLLSLAKVVAGYRGRDAIGSSIGNQRLLVIVPAHNEAGQIGPCVQALTVALSGQQGTRLLVVSDNSTDSTAGEARAAGAEVWEREDPKRPGKPKAVEWALARTELSDIDALVIIDADTIVDHDFFEKLQDSGPLTGRVVQTYYGLKNDARSWTAILAGVLVRSRYEGQYQLRRLARLNAPMTGNGMVIGRRVLRRYGWAHDSLTENWEMYTRYTLAGVRIDLQTDSRLEALEPDSVRDSSVRRQRWQAGKWQVLKRYASQLIVSPSLRIHQRIDLLGELLSPGPVAHAGLGLAIGFPLVFFSTSVALRVVGWGFILSPLPTVIWTLVATVRHPRPGRVAMALLWLPFYLLWRVTIFGRALPTYFKGVWQRSPRPGDS